MKKDAKKGREKALEAEVGRRRSVLGKTKEAGAAPERIARKKLKRAQRRLRKHRDLVKRHTKPPAPKEGEAPAAG
jgi:hypothetical protein